MTPRNVYGDNNNNKIIIIIALKGAVRDFYNLLTAPRTVLNTDAQVVRAQTCVNHVQHIEGALITCNLHFSTWYERTAQILSLAEFKSHLFQLYFIG